MKMKVNSSWNNDRIPSAPKKRGRKRKANHVDEEEDDFDPYWSHMHESVASMSEFDYNAYANGGAQAEASLSSTRGKVSREEKKLQYYLGMIQRQEKAEIKKKARKERKEKKPTNNVPKNSKKKPIMAPEPEFKEPLKLSLVSGYDKELDEMAKFMQQSIVAGNEEFSIGVHDKFGHSDLCNSYKDDFLSCCQSEDPNESTLDRLRTPTQKPYNTSSIIAISGEVNIFDSSKFSNIIEKSSVQESDWDKNEEFSFSSSNCLKEDFCSRLLKLTRQRQNINKEANEKVPASVESPIEEKPLSSKEAMKPVFNVIRPKRELYKLSKLNKTSMESTQGSDLSKSEYHAPKLHMQATIQNEAVMLIS